MDNTDRLDKIIDGVLEHLECKMGQDLDNFVEYELDDFMDEMIEDLFGDNVELSKNEYDMVLSYVDSFSNSVFSNIKYLLTTESGRDELNSGI